MFPQKKKKRIRYTKLCFRLSSINLKHALKVYTLHIYTAMNWKKEKKNKYYKIMCTFFE